MTETNRLVFYVAGGIVGMVSLLLVVILPMSFVTLDYYEYWFKRQKSTGSVDISQVYSGGKYLLGPDVEFKVFKADAHYLSLTDILIFTADKLQVRITCHIQYFLRKDELPLLHQAYDIYYENVIESSAVDALKGAIPVYNTRELVSKREEVERVLYRAIQQRIGGTCCKSNCKEFTGACAIGCKAIATCTDNDKGLNVDVKYFQLTNIIIPSDVEERYMQALVLQENVLREQLYQKATIIRKETTQMVQSIQNQASEIQQMAQTQSQKIKTVSQAEYTTTIEKSRSSGLQKLYFSLGITRQEHKNSFDYLRTLRGLDNVHLTVDFQQRIAGSLG